MPETEGAAMSGNHRSVQAASSIRDMGWGGADMCGFRRRPATAVGLEHIFSRTFLPSSMIGASVRHER
jgi:hypothetical protein